MTSSTHSPARAAAPSPAARIVFLLPTYNEAENIEPLLARLTALYPERETAFLVVDDSSPDGTAARVRAFAARDARVLLLTGERRGLGDAIARGIAHALGTLRAEVVVPMDADFSHDPAQARRLLGALAGGADVAIGSRYVAGGTMDARWHPGRRLLSRWGNHLARWIAGLSAVRDCTAGFKALRASALRGAAVSEIRVQGYAFQVALLHRLLHTGARVVEVPIDFRERERGVTKLGVRDLLEFFYHIWWLRLASHRTFWKFAVTGCSGVVVNIGSFQVLLMLGVSKWWASPIAIELSILSNFLLNNYWTFAGRVMVGRKRVRGVKYNLVSLLTLALGFATFFVLSMLFPSASPVVLQACGILPSAVLNYFLNSYWTFREAE